MKRSMITIFTILLLLGTFASVGAGTEEKETLMGSKVGAPARELGDTYVNEDASTITIGNAHIEIVLSKDTGGGISKIIDKATGIDLRGNKVPPPIILMIYYWTGSSHDIVIQWDAGSIIYSNETSNDHSRVVMEYNRFKGKDLNATVTITLENNSRMAGFRLDIENDEEFIVKSLYFPVIWGLGSIGDEGNDDEVFYPIGDGMVMKDPLSHYGDMHMTEMYPSTASMQVMCHYDPDETGLYMAAYDTRGHPKKPSLDWMEWGGDKHFTGFFQHMIPESIGNDHVMDYECMVGSFEGDWLDAAEIYREWAATTPFVSGGKVYEDKDTPEWFSKTSIVSSSNRDADIIHNRLTDIVNITTEFSELTGVNTTHLIFAWAKNGAWVGPDYFPPAAGEENFKNATAEISGNGDHVLLYISGSVWRIGRGDIGYEDWEFFNTIGKPWACIDANGDPTIDAGYLILNWTSARMDPMTDFWHDTVVNNLMSCLDLGVDAVQIDEFPIGSIFPCYNASHGHPLGYSKEISEAYLSILQDSRINGRAENPDLIISMEEPCEFYLPYVDTYVSRDNSPEFMIYPIAVEKLGDDVEFVPFFSHVYHEHVTSFAEPIPMNLNYPELFTKQMRRSIARGFITGEIVSGSGDRSENLRSDVISLYNTTVRASAGYANDYLIRGKPLRAPTLDVPDILVDWYFYSNGSIGNPFHERSILNSAWKDDNGNIGHTLVNWDLTSRSFDIELQKYDLEDGKWSVIITKNGVREVLLRSTDLPVTVHLDMAPDDVVLLEVTRLPDLSIELEDVVISDDLKMTEEEYPVNITFHNDGTSPVGEIEIGFELNETPLEPVVFTEEVLPGASATIIWTLNTTGVVGGMELKVHLDPEDMIEELDENDNLVQFELDILPRPKGNISLMVLDNETGLPIGNATVALFRGSSLILENLTDENGSFIFSQVPASNYLIRVWSELYLNGSIDFQLKEGEDLEVGVRLDPLLLNFEVHGSVVDDVSGSPLDGVQIKLVFTENGTVIETRITSLTGIFVFTGLVSDNFTIISSKDGYHTKDTIILIELPDKYNEIEIRLVKSPIIPQLGSINGSVIGAETGDPLVGANITIDGVDGVLATTDDEGNFELMDLEPGSLIIWASVQEYHSKGSTVLIEAGNVTILTIELEKIVIPFIEKAVLRGIVRDVDGAPIAGAIVRMVGSSISITTGSDGAFIFEGLDPGTYVLSISAVGYMPFESYEITLGEGDDIATPVTLAKISEEATGKENEVKEGMLIPLLIIIVLLILISFSIFWVFKKRRGGQIEE